jgi:PAS domain S-box-containing protein
VASELSTLEKTENKFERQFKRMLELYVPIKFNDSKNIDTVIEIYQNLDPLYEDISIQKQLIRISIILGFSLLYVLLFGIVWRASKQIEKQTQKIMQSEESYRNLVQSALDAIISIDINGKMILFNKAAEQMFGYTAAEVIGQDPTILIPEQYKTKHISGMTHFFETGKTKIIGRTSEMEGMRRDGQSFSIELSLSASEGEDGPSVTGIFRDISERRAIQAQLIEMERQTSISTIAGGIGHEINNVIGGLMGYADLLKMKPHDSQLAQKSAEIFNAQSQRLKLHAHNLLSLSKPREPQMQPVDLNGLIEKVTELLCASGLLKMCTIIREYSKDIPEISGDEMLLEQLLRNLEINAAHAMNNQGILTLRTNMSESKSSVEFSITDTGHGIPDDKRGQIFLPFFTTKEKGKGTGLGMYIVKQVVDQHKGYIRLDSKVGIGTTITIGLPVKGE